MGETSKAHDRRKRENFFTRYCHGNGIDIGCGNDILRANSVTGWDVREGDAHMIIKKPDIKFDFVYSSHCLEHLDKPRVAIRNWWSIAKDGGYLILFVPHRDLYEKKTDLPSKWNSDHKWFFVTSDHANPHTIGIIQLIKEELEDYSLIYVKTCNEGMTIFDKNIHSNGEYSIEAVVMKNKKAEAL